MSGISIGKDSGQACSPAVVFRYSQAATMTSSDSVVPCSATLTRHDANTNAITVIMAIVTTDDDGG